MKKKLDTVILSIATLVVLYFIYMQYNLEYNYTYKVGVIKGRCINKKYTKSYEISYWVDNIEYTICGSPRTKTLFLNGDLLYVRVSKNDPEMGWVDIDKGIPPRE